MLRKLVLACAATVALGAAALISSTASAHGWHSGHGGWHGGGFHRGWSGPPRFAGRPVYFGGGYGGCYMRRLVPTPWGHRERLVNRCY
ncbi:MAG: sulfur globule protein precursor [Afipia sp.]|nr:sulfur globule protein precursor [Afipia sp.]